MSDTYRLLLADNRETSLSAYSQKLKQEGYDVRTTTTYYDALQIMQIEPIDLAVIDMRLQNDRNENDVSGLKLASETTIKHIPKIILTAFKVSPEHIRELTGYTQGSLPSVLTFVEKDTENINTLIEAIRTGLARWYQLQLRYHWQQQRFQQLEKAVNRIEEDYDRSREQAKSHARDARIAALLGFVLILVGSVLVMLKIVPAGTLGIVAGILLELPVVLFYTRLDKANELSYAHHREQLQTHWFEILLSTCEQLPPTSEIVAKQSVIKATAEGLLAGQKKLVQTDAKRN